jgi:hypothetical protein
MVRLTVVKLRPRAVGEEAASSFYRQGQGSSHRNDGSPCPPRTCHETRDGTACRLMKRIDVRVVTTARCTGVRRQ